MYAKVHVKKNTFYCLGNFPHPVIRKKYSGKLECASLYVTNSNNLTWQPTNKNITKGAHYWLNETHDYLSDGYRRLQLSIKNKKLPGMFGIQDFDVTENMRSYYLTFLCIASFGNETVSRDYNATCIEKGKFL